MSLEPGLPSRRYGNQAILKDPRREDVVVDSVMQVKTWKIAGPRRIHVRRAIAIVLLLTD
jgi:hypothetical protein